MVEVDPIECLAANLERRRRELNLTEAELACQAGVSRATVHKMLEGKKSTRIDCLARVAWALDTTVSSLLDPRGPRDWPDGLPSVDEAPDVLVRLLLTNLARLEFRASPANGFPRATLEDIRAGKSKPTLRTLGRLATAVGVPVFALLHPHLSRDTPRVLLVDDNAQVLHAIKQVLGECGGIKDVTAVTRPAEALGALRATDFTVVVADFNLEASRNGLDVLRDARRLQPWARRVFMTSTVDVPFTTKTREFDAIVYRPASASALLAAVAPHLILARGA